MRRILMGVSVLLAVVLVGLFVAGAVFAQDPTPAPDTTTPAPDATTSAPDAATPAPGGWQGRSTLLKAVSDLLGMTPGQLLDAQLGGQTLLDIAKGKGVTEQQLTDAVQAARKASLDQAVKDGRMTQAQADQFTQNDPGNSAGPRGNGGRSPLGNFMLGGSPMFKAVADLLGMTPGQLLDAQLAGQTVLDIAKGKGVTEQQLADAILAARKDSLDQAVKAGRLTQAQADSSLERLKAMAPADLVNQLDSLDNGPQGGPGGGMRGGGRPFGGPRGNRRGASADTTPAPESTTTP
jgi:hypothetical protein